MQYIKQRLESAGLKFLIGTVTIGIVAIAVFRFRNFKKPLKPTPRQKSELLSQISMDTISVQPCSESDFARVINSVKKLIPKAGKLDLQTIRAIYVAQHQLSRNAFETVVRRNRIARRNIMSDLNAYKQKVLELQYQIQDLHNRNLDVILAHFKIGKREWYETVTQMAQKESEKWELMIIQTEESQLDALRDKNRPVITMTQLVKMCVYKAEIIQELIAEMNGLFRDSDRNQVFSLLDRRMSDLLFMKFNAQQEDINYSLTKISPEQHRVLEGLEEKVNEVLSKLMEELQIA